MPRHRGCGASPRPSTIRTASSSPRSGPAGSISGAARRGTRSQSWSARTRCGAPPISPRCSSSSRDRSPRRTRRWGGPGRPSHSSRRPWPRPSRCDTASVISSGRAASPRPIWPPGASRTRSPWPSFTWRSRGRCTCGAPRRGLCAWSPTWRSTAKTGCRGRQQALAAALVIAEELGMRPLAARCWLTRAALDLACGRPGDARRAATMALAQFHTLDMPRFAAQAEAMLRRA